MDDIRKWKQATQNHYELDRDYGQHDHEASMARGQLYHIAKDAIKLIEMIKKGDNLEGWVASKITKAKENSYQLPAISICLARKKCLLRLEI